VESSARKIQLREENQREQMERAVLPHLDAAYNLARWLTRNDHDAEDVVQEAFMRACQFFGGFHGDSGRAWLLRIVRNTGYTWLQKNRPREPTVPFEEEVHGLSSPGPSPEALAVLGENRELLRQALEELPVEYREIVVLRELEGLSYKEIAAVVDIPLGTVMSRLARARDRLQHSLARHLSEET
jgi:RNA polymerase sigma-70 factor (ECF subfamily)